MSGRAGAAAAIWQLRRRLSPRDDDDDHRLEVGRAHATAAAARIKRAPTHALPRQSVGLSSSSFGNGSSSPSPSPGQQYPSHLYPGHNHSALKSISREDVIRRDRRGVDEASTFCNRQMTRHNRFVTAE